MPSSMNNLITVQEINEKEIYVSECVQLSVSHKISALREHCANSVAQLDEAAIKEAIEKSI
jgi:hypothetical protein